MTVISDNGLHMCACDGCGAELDTHDEFQAAADNERLRTALMSIERIGIAHSDSFARQIKEAQDIARAALGREGDA